METLLELLSHELADLISAEKQLIQATPKLIRATTTNVLKTLLQRRLTRSESCLRRLERVFAKAELKGRKKCKAMELLLEAEVITQDGNRAVREAGLIGAVQRVEHYCIASYDGAAAIADAMDLRAMSRELRKLRDAHQVTDDSLSKLSRRLEDLPGIE